MKYKSYIIKEDNEIFEKFTAYEVAKILGVEHSYVYRIKNGQVIPSERKYKQIRKKLGLD